MNVKVDELQNEMKSKDEKISTLENSISTVKERCAAKLKVGTVCFIRAFCVFAEYSNKNICCAFY